MVRVVKRSRPRIVIPICVGSNPIMHPKLNSTACVKLIDDGPNCQGLYLISRAADRARAATTASHSDFMHLEGRERSLFIVFCTFKHNAVGC